MGFFSKTEQPAAAATTPAGPGEQPPSAASASSQHVELQVVQATEPPVKPPQADHLTPAQKRTLAHVQMLTKMMDTAVRVPGTNFRFGADALIGMVPFVGDAVGAMLGTYIVHCAMKYHLPKRVVVRMMINTGIDAAVGVVPFIGDVFDVVHKANTKNMLLLQAHLQNPKEAKKADGCFLFGMFLLVVVLPVALFVLIVGGIIVGIVFAVKR